MKGSTLMAAAFGIAFAVLYGYVQKVQGYVDGVTVTAKAYEEHRQKEEES